MSSPKESMLDGYRKQGFAVSDERIQQTDDPIAELKSLPDRAVVVVPAEYLWDARLKPGTNPLHKRQYDADLLAEHLEAAGYATHIIRLFESAGWSWLYAECVRLRSGDEASEDLPDASGVLSRAGQTRPDTIDHETATRSIRAGMVSSGQMEVIK